MTLLCGIDESARGPVIGPLIIAGVLLNKSKEDAFREQGIKDSKLLTQPQRVKLAEFIKREADDYFIITVPVEEIDAAVESTSTNLNWLEADKSVEIINKLDPDVAILDCPSTVPKKYEAYVRQRIDKDIKLVVEHKADLNYVACAAASILAKCLREELVQKLKEEFGNIGSGYPSDPTTQRFLREKWNKFPELFRKSWASWKKVAEAKKQKGLGDF